MQTIEKDEYVKNTPKGPSPTAQSNSPDYQIPLLAITLKGQTPSLRHEQG